MANKSLVKPYSVIDKDLRWERCHVNPPLLANVLHFQHGYEKGNGETLLFNANNELTEASACNAFIVKDGIANSG